MNNKVVLLILGFVLGLFVALFGYLYMTYQQKTSQAVSQVTDMTDHSGHMAQGMPSMNSMMKQYSDLEFLNLMIVHHQDALDMAQRALVGSSNNFIKELSNNIIKSQSKEINDMKIEIDKIINQNR
jgi:uncharacterized protein (DUF305 family)